MHFGAIQSSSSLYRLKDPFNAITRYRSLRGVKELKEIVIEIKLEVDYSM